MRIDCKAIFAGVDLEIPIDYSPALSERDVLSGYQFTEPAQVRGHVVNEAGVVTVSFTVSFTLRLACDRCAEEFMRHFTFSSESVLVTHANRELPDDYVVIPDAQLDMDELCESCILLAMPSKNLCAEDCKGLCPVCGQNLNRGGCACKNKDIDPRLAKLGQLLQ